MIENRSAAAVLAFYLILHSFFGMVFDVWDILNAHKHDLAKAHVTFFRTIKGYKATGGRLLDLQGVSNV